MKTIAVVLVSAFIASLCLESEAKCLYPNNNGTYASMGQSLDLGCTIFTCKEGGWLGKGCAASPCQGSYDLSKPYPYCCPLPC